MPERSPGEQALLNAVVRQRDEAMNQCAQAQAVAEVALSDNKRLSERVQELEAQLKGSKQDGDIADGAGAGTAAVQPGHA